MVAEEKYRVVAVGSLGPMSPYGTHGSRDEAERLLRDIEESQAASPFPTGGAWIERDVDGEWVRA